MHELLLYAIPAKFVMNAWLAHASASCATKRSRHHNHQARGCLDRGARMHGLLFSSKSGALRKRNLLLVCRGRWHSLRHQLNNFVLYKRPKPRDRALILHRDPLIGASIYVYAVRHLVTLEVKAEEKWVYTVVLTVCWDSIHLSWVFTE